MKQQVADFQHQSQPEPQPIPQAAPFLSTSTIGQFQNQQLTQPLQLKAKSLTCAQLQRNIKRWNPLHRIEEKFSLWNFSFNVKEIVNVVPQQFFQHAIHYVCFKKMHLLLKDYDHSNLLAVSSSLKASYEALMLKQKKLLKNNDRFNHLMLTVVKVVSYYIGSHTKEIIVDEALESEFYVILCHVLFGNMIGSKVYSVIAKNYRKNKNNNHRSSTLTVLNQSSELCMNSIYKQASNSEYQKNLNSIQHGASVLLKRRACAKSGDARFPDLQMQSGQSRINEKEIRQMIKKSLAVRQFIPLPKPKQSLNKALDSISCKSEKARDLAKIKGMQNTMKHNKIGYAQLSKSFSMGSNGDTKLSHVQNHSIEIRPQKRSNFYTAVVLNQIHQDQSTSKATNGSKIIRSACNSMQGRQKSSNFNIKLPQIPQVKDSGSSKYQMNLQRKKQSKYWKSVIAKMKSNQYLSSRFSRFSYQSKSTTSTPNLKLSQPQLSLRQFEMAPNKSKNQDSQVVQAPQQNQKAEKQNIQANQQQHQQQQSYSASTNKNIGKDKTKKTSQKFLKNVEIKKNEIERQENQIDKIILQKEKTFLTRYSNQNGKLVLKKTSIKHLKELNNNFRQQCSGRGNKLQSSMFALPRI